MTSPVKITPCTAPNRIIHNPRRRTRRRASAMTSTRTALSHLARATGSASTALSAGSRSTRSAASLTSASMRREAMVMIPKPNSMANSG